MKISKFLFINLVLIIGTLFVFSSLLSAQQESVYQRQMNLAYENGDLATMKQMLAKGAYLPDTGPYFISLFLQKPYPIFQFMFDNGLEINNTDELFKRLFDFAPKDLEQKIKYLFTKGYFPSGDEQRAIKIIYEVSREVVSGNNDSLGSSSKEREQMALSQKAAYKYFLTQTKSFFSKANPLAEIFDYGQLASINDHAFKMDLVKHLIEVYKVDINSCIISYNSELLTPLQAASRTCRLDFMKYLVSKGANVNTVCNGKTALNYVAKHSSVANRCSDQLALSSEMYLMDIGAK
jgi:ankyrin repeat protein